MEELLVTLGVEPCMTFGGVDFLILAFGGNLCVSALWGPNSHAQFYPFTSLYKDTVFLCIL